MIIFHFYLFNKIYFLLHYIYYEIINIEQDLHYFTEKSKYDSLVQF